MRAEPGSGSDLPVPYRHPWRLLVSDLRALAASLVLKARELWRRNGEGDLWKPPFWPRSLAALFWPVLLTALLAMLVFLGLRPGATRLQPGVPAPRPPAETAPSAESPPPDVPPSVPAAAGSESNGGFSPSPPPSQETPVEPPPDPEAPALKNPDPLMLALGEGESDPLILSALADPGRSQLRLNLEPAFATLTVAARQERAERWQVRGQELGFGHLVLCDGEGRTLGRSALVGSGMILLDPSSPP